MPSKSGLLEPFLLESNNANHPRPILIKALQPLLGGMLQTSVNFSDGIIPERHDVINYSQISYNEEIATVSPHLGTFVGERYSPRFDAKQWQDAMFLYLISFQ
jgi:hypothetical protein